MGLPTYLQQYLANIDEARPEKMDDVEKGRAEANKKNAEGVEKDFPGISKKFGDSKRKTIDRVNKWKKEHPVKEELDEARKKKLKVYFNDLVLNNYFSVLVNEEGKIKHMFWDKP